MQAAILLRSTSKFLVSISLAEPTGGNRNNSAMIAFLHLLTHMRLINLITTLSKLFLAISGLSNCHDFAFTKTLLLHFSCAAGEMLGAEGVRSF
jgi:hypothetical protein